MSREKVVEELLLDLFTPDELLRFIRHFPEGGRAAHDIPQALPPAEHAHQAVRALSRHGLMGVNFFGALCAERPARTSQIKAAGEAWFRPAASGTGGPANGEPRPTASAPRPATGAREHETPKAPPPPIRPSESGVTPLGALVGAGLAGLGIYALSKAAGDSARKDKYRKVLFLADEGRLRRMLRDRGFQPKIDELELVDQALDTFELNDGLIAQALTLEQLRFMCRTLGLPAGGSKQDLSARIAADLDEAA